MLANSVGVESTVSCHADGTVSIPTTWSLFYIHVKKRRALRVGTTLALKGYNMPAGDEH